MQQRYMAGLGLALAASAAVAQSDSPASPAALAPTDRFISLDVNGDGALSRSELGVSPELQQGFETRDRNKDGTLSMLEFSASPAPAAGVRREFPEPPTRE